MHTNVLPTKARENPPRPARRYAWLPVAIAAFLLLSWSPLHHWDEFPYLYALRTLPLGELLELEAEVVDAGLFNAGFFRVKAGFLAALGAVIRVVGDGWRAVYAIQALFAVVVLGFVGASYLLVREVFGARRAGPVAAMLLFLPLTAYFAFKVLTEPASLLFAALGTWAFLRSFPTGDADDPAERANGVHPADPRRAAPLRLAAAAVGLAIGMTFRVYSVVFFVGAVAGLLALRDRRFPTAAVLARAAATGLLALGLLAAVEVALGSSVLDVVLGPVRDVVSKPTVDWAARVYAFAMFLQLAAPFVALSLLRRRDGMFRFAAVWFGVGTLPFVLGHEPRYYAAALVPLAILAHLGLDSLASAAAPRRARAAWVLGLALMAGGNRLLFAELQPWNANLREYRAALVALDAVAPDATLVVPWISDYALLRFARPDRHVMLGLSEGIDPNDAFLRFIGPRNYLGAPPDLASARDPLIYLAWTYNPVILRLRRHLAALGYTYIEDLERSSLRNHRTLSWLWADDSVRLEPAGTFGMYTAYRVVPNDAAPRPLPSGTDADSAPGG